MSDFNPSEHNIPDVNKHLEENPTEVQAVLDAEKAGKNRPSLVSALEEQLAAVPQTVDSPAVTVEPAVAPTAAPSFYGNEYEVSPERGYRRKK